jgi:hypothetical protein
MLKIAQNISLAIEFDVFCRNISMFSRNFYKLYAFLFFLFLLIAPLSLAAQIHASPMTDNAALKSGPAFPSMLFTDTIINVRRIENSRPYWVNTFEEDKRYKIYASGQISLLLNNDILAYYGHPHSRNMGILGRYTPSELNTRLTETAAKYEEVSGGRGIKKAFYLIYGTVWPEGEIGILGHETVMRYINYGLDNDMLVFIDHQIGKYDPVESLRKMLPYLHYPNVHLALDPEWRTARPMVDFGYVTGDEINKAQQVMEDYIVANDLPGERILVIHQFNYMMLRNRGVIKTDFERVRLIHCMDGIGTPEMKKDTYAFNALATNMPNKGFKLFYNLGVRGAGFDNPIMSPEEVYELTPRPIVIMYQ